MKRNITLLLFILCLSAAATHNRSGEILYKRIPPYTGYTYSITVIKYTNHGPNIADRCVDTIYFGDGNKATVPRSNGVISMTSGCVFNGSSIGSGEVIANSGNYIIKKNIYTTTHTYAGTGNYLVRSWDPSRSSGIQNIPNSSNVSFYLQSLIIINPSFGINSSPVFSNPPTEQGNMSFYYHNPGAYDAEKDSLSYQLVPCMSELGIIPNYTFPPFGAGGSFAIDPLSGLLTYAKPQFQGEYSIAIVVSEWRKTGCSGNYSLIGYVIRDMQITIGTATNQVSFQGLQDTCVVAGSIINTNFVVNAPNGANLTLYGALKNPDDLQNASINNTSGSGSFTRKLTWPTSCNQLQYQPYQGIVVAESNLMKYYKQFKIKVVPPAPVIKSMVVDTSKVILTWNKSSCSARITGYKIYRKIGSNNWTHAACENGVPANSGFQLIGSIPASDTTFTDNDLWTTPNGSEGNYLVTALSDNCIESFADSAKSKILIVGLNKNSLAELNISVYPNPFTDEIIINFEGNYFDEVSSTIYSADGRLVFKRTDKKVERKLVLPVEGLVPGVYFLSLKNKEGQIYKKLVRE